MPNHVHVLFEPTANWTAARIVASWKSFTGRKIIARLRQALPAPPRRLWHREYWDRFIRDERHLSAAIDYIHQNPVKVGLVAAPDDYPWSSARFIAGLRPDTL